MSKRIEFTDQDYARIQHAAHADGMSVDAWVMKNLPLNGNGKPNGNGSAAELPLPDAEGKPVQTMYDLLKDRIGLVSSGAQRGGPSPRQAATGSHPAPAPLDTDGKPMRTLADRFAGRLGVIDSGGDGRLSENTGERFTDYLEEKQRAGRL